jgi:hypothetical protein
MNEAPRPLGVLPRRAANLTDTATLLGQVLF